jgi:succinate dehydrogenase / fumarate reductase cytochrome b subunit
MDTVSTDPKPSWGDRLNIKWLLRLFSSSIGQKFVMALTGLGLSGFLVVHLAGNLFLYKGPEAFNKYALTLHEQEWLPLAEAGLFVMFAFHIYLAFSLTAANKLKRNVGYAKKETKIPGQVVSPMFGPPSNWMFVSGLVVFAFLILHIIDMKLHVRSDLHYVHEHDVAPYLNTVAVLSNPFSRFIYIVGTIFLGFHLSHGFASAFQSLGLNHPKYMPLLKVFSIVFAIVIAAGFCSLPILIPTMIPVAPQ